jgi:hypothetical protein
MVDWHDTPPPPPGAPPVPRPVAGKWYVCDLCGHKMLDVHCKLRCERCGFVRDCSDP